MIPPEIASKELSESRILPPFAQAHVRLKDTGAARTFFPGLARKDRAALEPQPLAIPVIQAGSQEAKVA